MSSYKKILTLDNQIKAGLLEAVLKEKGIPHIIKSYRDPAFDNVAQLRMGWGHIEAPGEFKQEIEEIWTDLNTPVNQIDE